MSQPKMKDVDYALLADFRATLRAFMAFSETQARSVGLTPQQHQALLTIRGTASGNATVGYVAQCVRLVESLRRGGTGATRAGSKRPA